MPFITFFSALSSAQQLLAQATAFCLHFAIEQAIFVRRPPVVLNHLAVFKFRKERGPCFRLHSRMHRTGFPAKADSNGSVFNTSSGRIRAKACSPAALCTSTSEVPLSSNMVGSTFWIPQKSANVRSDTRLAPWPGNDNRTGAGSHRKETAAYTGPACTGAPYRSVARNTAASRCICHEKTRAAAHR